MVLTLIRRLSFQVGSYQGPHCSQAPRNKTGDCFKTRLSGQRDTEFLWTPSLCLFCHFHLVPQVLNNFSLPKLFPPQTNIVSQICVGLLGQNWMDSGMQLDGSGSFLGPQQDGNQRKGQGLEPRGQKPCRGQLTGVIKLPAGLSKPDTLARSALCWCLDVKTLEAHFKGTVNQNTGWVTVLAFL